MRRLSYAAAAFALTACATTTPIPVVRPTLEPPPGAPAAPPANPATPPPKTGTKPAPPSQPAAPAASLATNAGAATIRVALRAASSDATIASADAWELFGSDGAKVLVRAAANEAWRIERDGHRLRGARVGSGDAFQTDWTDGPLLARAVSTGLLTFNGKRYRGDLVIFAGDSGTIVVNRLTIDDYLLGVVPLEIGTRAPAESAAVQAQAVAARSYAFVHLSTAGTVRYDVTATVLDQVYGGVDAESPLSTQAVVSTRGLVLKYAGRVVNAPYHSSCGGTTAEPQEVWRSDSEPYLKRVSDQIPGTDRYYCDIAPKFSWTQTFTASQLNATVSRYLASYTSVPNGNPGTVRDVSIASQTPSGRAGTLTVSTEHGNFVLRGNDIRSVLRSPSGEILNSTLFSIESTRGPDGELSELTVRGRGNGHGVGMCQWGAIGRARAGQDFRTILLTYYPGTTVGPMG